MTKIKLYIDEDSMDEDFIQALRSRNIDVLTVADVGILYKSDLEQIRELHKKDELLAAALRYPILWDGHLARPYIISGQDARTTRNFGISF
jgi:hypothetical protein